MRRRGFKKSQSVTPGKQAVTHRADSIVSLCGLRFPKLKAWTQV